MNSLDIIIPIYNEEKVIPILIEKLKEVFSEEQKIKNSLHLIHYIFIDDGSKDKSVQLLEQEVKSLQSATIIKLSRNFGHQSALTAGLSLSKSDYAAIIDADLQDPPELIFNMLTLARSGHEVVYAQRKNRKEFFLKKMSYWIFYRIYKWLSPIDIPLDSGDFSLMSRVIVNELNKLPEKLRFPRGLRTWVGYRQIGLSYNRPPRAAGETKYHFKDLYQLATDGITSLSIRPLKAGQLLLFIHASLSLVLLSYVCLGMLGHNSSMPRSTALILISIFAGNTLTTFYLYILGAYIGRTYIETKGRPNFIIDKITSVSQ